MNLSQQKKKPVCLTNYPLEAVPQLQEKTVGESLEPVIIEAGNRGYDTSKLIWK